MRILGIESSCDETAVAIYDGEQGLLSHTLHSQVALHQVYGGVVPELASRDHICKILPLVQAALTQAHTTREQLDAIAYTAGPGLVGALLVGATVGASIACALNIPAIPVHHLEGHLLAPMLETPAPAFPFIALLVSGGHTLLIEVKGIGNYQTLGQSLDDAVGEAFDKTAKLIGLPYPGGPALAELAITGTPGVYTFARPMMDRPGLDFSFSGLKTQVVNAYHQSTRDDQACADIAHAFQEAAVDVLMAKSLRALKQTGVKRLVVAGGVGANKLLRARLSQTAHQEEGFELFFPRFEFCTDNAAMIAFAGYQRLLMGDGNKDACINVKARWPMEDLVFAT